jgi:hypothetical protein
LGGDTVFEELDPVSEESSLTALGVSGEESRVAKRDGEVVGS